MSGLAISWLVFWLTHIFGLSTKLRPRGEVTSTTMASRACGVGFSTPRKVIV